MNRQLPIIMFATAVAIVAVLSALAVSPGVSRAWVRTTAQSSVGVPHHGGIAGTVPMIAVAPVVTLTPSPTLRVASFDPPPSASSVLAHSPFYLEIWATSASGPVDGLACVYGDVQLDPPGAISTIAPAQDSLLFPINAVSGVFNGDPGVVGDVGGCQTVPTIDALGVDEWVLIKTISMKATSALGPVNISLRPGDNVFAGVSIIGHVNGVDAADITYHGAVMDVVCEFGDIVDLAAVAAFQNCFAGGAAESATGPGCGRFDADCDLDTDLNDYAGLFGTLYGP